MAPQHISTIVKAAWLKKPAAKLLCLCVAGLLCTATFHPFASHPVEQSTISLTKPASSGSGSCTERSKQSVNSSTFSLMPGRLNRFLQ